MASNLQIGIFIILALCAAFALGWQAHETVSECKMDKGLVEKSQQLDELVMQFIHNPSPDNKRVMELSRQELHRLIKEKC